MSPKNYLTQSLLQGRNFLVANAFEYGVFAHNETHLPRHLMSHALCVMRSRRQLAREYQDPLAWGI